MTRTTTLVRAAVAGLALSALLPASAAAQKHDPRRTIIVFGGFGYFDDSQHRRLIQLIGRDATPAADVGARSDTLEDQVAAAARKTLSGGMPNWSRHGVVFGIDDLERAFTTATGPPTPGKAPVVDTRAMVTEFERIYMIVLSSSFEHQSVLRTAYADKALYHAYTEVGVSASIVDLRGSGDILLSTSVMGIHVDNGLSAPGTDDDPAWAARYRAAYAVGADKALGLLRRLGEQREPSRMERTNDAYAVTGALVTNLPTEESQRAAALFEWQPVESIGSFCLPVNACRDGSAACAAMRAYLINAVSQALSEAGHRVLPPLTWQAGTRRPDDIARYTLSLPATPLPEIATSTDIDFDPRRATFKVIAQLNGLIRSTEVSNNGRLATDEYAASVNATIARTDPDSCRSTPKDVRILDRKGAGLGVFTDVHPASEAALSVDAQRFLFLRAMNRALSSIAASGAR